MNRGSDNSVLPANILHGGRVMWKVLKCVQWLMYNYWLELLIYGGCASLILLQFLPG